MRAKVPISKQSKTRGISLSPSLMKYASEQGFRTGWGFSGFMATAVEYLRDNNLIDDVIKHRMSKKSTNV